MTDVDDLADLIAEAPFTRTGHTVMFTDPTARLVAQRIIDAGYRRVVIDDATIERAARAIQGLPWNVITEGAKNIRRAHAKAALIAALGDDQ